MTFGYLSAQQISSIIFQCGVLYDIVQLSLIAYSSTSQKRTIFASSARAHERARVQNIRDFPQTKLDSEIKALFLLNEHGDPHFLFYKFNENNTRNNWEKIWQKSMATFLANEINATDREVTAQHS